MRDGSRAQPRYKCPRGEALQRQGGSSLVPLRACQADALGEIATIEGYVDWAAGLLAPIPDGHYELKSFSVDEERGNASVFAIFHGTNTGEGPVPPTGNEAAVDYVYVMDFDGDKIRHMTKFWNDVHSFKQLGWA